MPIPPDAGPQVPDFENVLRGIVDEMQWDCESDCPSSAAFDKAIFSVDRSALTTPPETVARLRSFGMSVLALVEFNCGEARKHGFDTRDERDDVAPDNAAHAHVYNLWYTEESTKAGRKKKARKMKDICSKVTF